MSFVRCSLLLVLGWINSSWSTLPRGVDILFCLYWICFGRHEAMDMSLLSAVGKIMLANKTERRP